MAFTKKYGLIVPEKGKSQPVFQATRNVFGDDSDSESESSKKPVLLRPSDNINRQAKITQEKAVIEDPTVYQYDEIYDSMASKKEEKMVKSKEEKKPRYIENLMKTANKRKIENERRMERQIQKERENEGDMFADKEVFVTSAYKKKLEEIKLEEEKEKYEEYLENIGDVTKQSDLGGFYRHLYEQKLGSDRISDQQKQTQDQPQHNLSKESSEFESKKDKETSTILKKRNYRKRKSQDNNIHLSEGEIEDSEEEINRINLKDIKNAKRSKCNENIDADSDFSIDDSSDNNDDDCNTKQKSSHSKFLTDNMSATAAKNELTLKEINTENSLRNSTITEKDEDEKETKIKVDIWKKRTVGTVFEEALKRYYERKATRGM